mgnify:FL=1
MRTLLLTILGCLAFTAGHAGAAQNPAPETAGAQQDAKARGAHLRMEVAGHDFGDVPRKGGDLGAMTLDAFKEKILEEVKTRARD